ncbi:MAG: zf-TFIIB domain-containing protein [Xenococcaceae cyanobacterium]
MNPITCPKCGGNLEQVVHGGIEVDRCLNCAGIWFDSLEAEKLKAIKDSESVDIGNPQTSSHFDRIEGEIDCPRCHAKMIPMLDIDKYSIWYEKCPECHGVWFDAGEFKKFKRNFKPRGLLYGAIQVFRQKRD